MHLLSRQGRFKSLRYIPLKRRGKFRSPPYLTLDNFSDPHTQIKAFSGPPYPNGHFLRPFLWHYPHPPASTLHQLKTPHMKDGLRPPWIFAKFYPPYMFISIQFDFTPIHFFDFAYKTKLTTIFLVASSVIL